MYTVIKGNNCLGSILFDLKEQQLDGRTLIHPYDDPYIIAGQGTVGVEILRQTKAADIAAIFICVGGGGLSAGIASYVKRLYPEIKIIGVETFDAPAMTESLLRGAKTDLQQVGPFADGAAVPSFVPPFFI